MRPRTLPDATCQICRSIFRPRSGNPNRFCSRKCYRGGTEQYHSPASIAGVRTYWDAGLTLTQIGRKIGVTRNVVAGIVHRNKFTPRPSPIRRTASSCNPPL